jgi:hypothetical protein
LAFAPIRSRSDKFAATFEAISAKSCSSGTSHWFNSLLDFIQHLLLQETLKARCGDYLKDQKRTHMLDILFVGIGLGFLAIAAIYAEACERL